MEARDYTTVFTVGNDAQQVFNAITNPRCWWSEAIEGDTNRQGAVFFYRYRDFHRCTIKVAELVPGRKVVWHVLYNDFSFVADRNEWTDTNIIFEISRRGEQTEVRFTHVGLVPEYECYGACSDGWRTYINGSLWQLIETGEGRPNAGEAVTESERSLNG